MTTPVTKGGDPIDLLAQRLIDVYGLKEELDVKDLLGVIKAGAPITEAAAAAPKAAPVRIMRRMCVRVGGYFDLTADLVVFDSLRGTLGLVARITGSGDVLRASLRKAINSATSLRQLLIEQSERGRDRTQAPTAPLQVELLLLVDALQPATPAGSDDADAVLSDVLSAIAREGGHLRLIGIGILRAEAGTEMFSERALRRAFPWLLTATMKWFSRPEFHSTEGSWRPAGVPFELRLQDYRAANLRKLRAATGVSLQLIHGNNGTGKSSIAEALELLLTGRIERLEDGGESNYFQSVRYRPPGDDNEALQRRGNAEVNVYVGSSTASISGFTISKAESKRTGETPKGKLHVNSFRLDQVFMDRLVRATPDKRATIFLDAFSPTEREAIEAQRKLRDNFMTSLAALPQHARTSAPTEETALFGWAQTRFGWLRESKKSATNETVASIPPPTDPALRRATLEALLPLPFDDLRIVVRPDDAVHDPISKLEKAATRDEVTALVGSIDEALPKLLESINQAAEPMRVARNVFDQFRGWTAREQQPSGESLKSDLDEFLDAQAMLDLLEKRAQIADTITAAEQRGWAGLQRESALLRKGAAAASFSAELGKQKAASQTRMADAESRVHNWLRKEGRQRATEGATQEASTIRRRLSPNEIDCLNRAGSWLSPDKPTQPIGLVFDKALETGKGADIAGGHLGREGGLEPVLDQTRRVLDAFGRLQQGVTLGASKAKTALERVSTLAESADALSATSADPLASLFRGLARGDAEVRQLVGAVNELLAMMTPARWQYRDIQLGAQIGTDGASVALTTAEGARADLLFNTAEMNAFALTLFLLLAPRLDNALRLIVLDDPLQNMDELTVITVARALSRLMRVYPPQWQILALFHSEADIDRIQEETLATRHSLPWVRATQGTTEETIPSDSAAPQWPPPLQQIPEKFVAALPPVSV